MIPNWLQQLASPPTFYRQGPVLRKWLGWIAAGAIAAGTYGGLVMAPPDYQQGDAFRIIYVHVPAAWLSLFGYLVMACAALIGLVWRIKLAECVVVACAPVGASFTALALVTGMLWGKPMWGTYWVWDARLTSELILLLLYLGIVALHQALPDARSAARACGLLAVVGAINVPIVHYSVEWWNTLHQTATITRFDRPAMALSMLWPLLVMMLGATCFAAQCVIARTESALLWRERDSRWVRELSNV